MSDSRAAGLVQLIQAATLSPSPVSIGPAPLPLNTTVDPGITISEMLTMELENIDGRSFLTETIMQINCISKNYETAWQLREQVKDLIIEYTGQCGTTNQYIDSVNHNTDREFYDDPRELHICITRLHIWWTKQTADALLQPETEGDVFSPVPDIGGQ